MLRQDFNVPIINILWQLVAGYRFTEEHKHGLEVVEAVNTIFSTGMKTFFFPLWFLKVFHKIHIIGFLPNFFVPAFPRIFGLQQKGKHNQRTEEIFHG